MSIRLVTGGVFWSTLLISAMLLTAAPASGALVLADSDDQTGLPDVGTPGTFPDDGYDGTLGSMEQFTLLVDTEYDQILGAEMSMWLLHGAVGQVFAKLESPEGTRITIFNRPGLPDAGDVMGSSGTHANFAGDVELEFRDPASVSAAYIGKDLATDEIVGTHSGNEYEPYANDSEDSGGFGAFVGEDPNGVWTLYLADTGPTWMGGIEIGHGGELHRWQLRMTAIPEPTTLMLTGVGAMLLAARKRSRRDLPTG